MGDILKEAIADAKAVRETALENAKMALEEAFTPQIKSMLSAKLKEEEDEVGEDEMSAEEGEHEEGEEAEEGEHAEEDSYSEDDEVGGDEVADEVPAAEDGEVGDGEVADEVPAEEVPADEVPAEEGEHTEEDEDNLDLEAVIAELEAELSDDEEVEEDEDGGEPVSTEIPAEEDEEYEIDEAALTAALTEEDDDDDDEDDKDEVDEELDKSSDIGKGDNNRGSTDASSAIGGGKKGMTEVQAELKEYKEAVSFLKDKLHEVNILNAKLLFTNKLFKSYSLNNKQKLKVVETFDRAQTTREIKLVYSTLAEQFGDNSSIVTKKSISESASSAVASTKPSTESRKVISEETNVADRFRKLAGLIK